MKKNYEKNIYLMKFVWLSNCLPTTLMLIWCSYSHPLTYFCHLLYFHCRSHYRCRSRNGNDMRSSHVLLAKHCQKATLPKFSGENPLFSSNQFVRVCLFFESPQVCLLAILLMFWRKVSSIRQIMIESMWGYLLVL